MIFCKRGIDPIANANSGDKGRQRNVKIESKSRQDFKCNGATKPAEVKKKRPETDFILREFHTVLYDIIQKSFYQKILHVSFGDDTTLVPFGLPPAFFGK